MKLALLLTTILLAAPATARATPLPTLVTRDVPVAGARALQSSQPPPRFNLVGLHWQGPGSVEFRTRSTAGRWSAWRPAAPEEEDRPDTAASERGVAGWRLGSPWWTGASDRIEYRFHGTVRRLRAHFVWSPAEAAAPRVLQARRDQPPIIPRLSWGANELIKKGTPSYASSLQLAVVHHTAGSNNYTKAQSAAIVRGIQIYHVQGNGWNDIGYNFLVDKYGQIFEGRFGGMERNVVGAHAEGFNTGSAGVAILGNHSGTGITAAGREALVRTISWRLDVAHVDPLTTFNAISGGNARFPRGIPVFLRAIVGHRDTGFTDCPGAILYAALDGLARDVSRTGLPKLYAPVVVGSLGGPVRFTARVSSALPWTVKVSDAAGTVVAQGAGAGVNVDGTWDSAAAPAGSYTYAIESGAARAATGTVGARPAVLTLSAVRAHPEVVSPNGDGYDDAGQISYVLGAPATVTAKLVNAEGAELATLFSGPRAAGSHRFRLDVPDLPDGSYRVVLVAVNGGGRTVTGSTPLVVDRTLAAVAASRKAFSPNGDGRADTIAFRFELAAAASVRVRVLRAGAWVATPLLGELEAGPQSVVWDGRKRVGRLPDGAYEVEVSASTPLGTAVQRVPFVSDTRAPTVARVPGAALRFRLSEPGELVVVAGGRRLVVKVARAGIVAAPGLAGPGTATPWDAAGNRGRPLRF